MRLADARIVEVREGGHFAHEDAPDQVESIIVESARNAGLLAGIPAARDLMQNGDSSESPSAPPA
jgi:hypothetical protein